MCGIVGYVGEEDCATLLVDGLRKLEYRGYDSAGVAVLGKEGLSVVRAKGKLANLEKRLSAPAPRAAFPDWPACPWRGRRTAPLCRGPPPPPNRSPGTRACAARPPAGSRNPPRPRIQRSRTCSTASAPPGRSLLAL